MEVYRIEVNNAFHSIIDGPAYPSILKNLLTEGLQEVKGKVHVIANSRDYPMIKEILKGISVTKVKGIVKPVPHLHITFTIPKILRAYFRRNRKLLKLLVQSANYSVERYFTEALGIEDGDTGGIYCIHSQGSLFNVHPHTHALVPAGIMKGGVFYEQRNISTPVIAEIFRARLLTVLLEQGVITQELINMLMCWNHHSGFNVHVRGEIAGADGDAIESIARYTNQFISKASLWYNRRHEKN